MRKVLIPKPCGGARTIFIPSRPRQAYCRRLLPLIDVLVQGVCDRDIVHGFMPMRSPVTAAEKHCRRRWSLSVDIEDAFGSTSCDMVYIGLERASRHPAVASTWPKMEDWVRWAIVLRTFDPCFERGCLVQGLATSPALFNLAMAAADEELRRLSPVYTRYADDLAWSADDRQTLDAVLPAAESILHRYGYRLSPGKTRLQDGLYRRRILYGVSVADDIRPTRRARRMARAAAHRAQLGVVSPRHRPHRQWRKYRESCRHRGVHQMPYDAWARRWLAARANGLAEWCKLRRPIVGRRSLARAQREYEPNELLSWLVRRALQ